MSKKSQREARQMKEEIEQQKRSKFLETLDVYLKMFAESLPRNKDLGPMTDLSAAAFDVGLQDLSPEQLKIGCEEILRRATFFPTPGEVRDALNAYLGRQPAASSSWDESLRNLNSQWNRAVRWKAWKEGLTEDQQEKANERGNMRDINEKSKPGKSVICPKCGGGKFYYADLCSTCKKSPVELLNAVIRKCKGTIS